MSRLSVETTKRKSPIIVRRLIIIIARPIRPAMPVFPVIADITHPIMNVLKQIRAIINGIIFFLSF